MTDRLQLIRERAKARAPRAPFVPRPPHVASPASKLGYEQIRAWILAGKTTTVIAKQLGLSVQRVAAVRRWTAREMERTGGKVMARSPRVCANCEITFVPPSASPNRITCSPKCARARRQTAWSGWDRSPRVCICEATFTPTIPTQASCSRPCAGRARRERSAALRSARQE